MKKERETLSVPLLIAIVQIQGINYNLPKGAGNAILKL